MSLRTIADHILDIAQNSVNAGARFIEVVIEENTKEGIFRFIVKDNGRGMDKEEIEKLFDPFYTTRDHKIRRVGLGLPMLKFACEATGGNIRVSSKKGVGTEIEAIFKTSHIDCQPVGDIGGVIFTLLFSEKNVDWVIKRSYNGNIYIVDSRNLRRRFSDEDLENPRVMNMIRNFIEELEKSIKEEET